MRQLTAARCVLGAWLAFACGGQLVNEVDARGGASPGGQGGVASGGRGSGGVRASGGTAGAACVDSRWADLPPCALIDACYPASPSIRECEQIGECSFRFAEPILSTDMHLNVTVDCTPVDRESCTFGDDQQTIILTGPACETARASDAPRLRVQTVHSCLY